MSHDAQVFAHALLHPADALGCRGQLGSSLFHFAIKMIFMFVSKTGEKRLSL
jgi:hypothetical protein